MLEVRIIEVKVHKIQVVNVSRTHYPETPANDKFYRRKFAVNEHLESHIKFLKDVIVKRPQNLVDAYVYIFQEDSNVWLRAQITDLTTKKNIFEVTLQNVAKETEMMDLMSDNVILDYNQDSSGPFNSVAKLKSILKPPEVIEKKVSKPIPANLPTPPPQPAPPQKPEVETP